MIEISTTPLFSYRSWSTSDIKHYLAVKIGGMGLTTMKFIPLTDKSKIMKTVKLEL